MTEPSLTFVELSNHCTCPFCGTEFGEALKASGRGLGPGSNGLCGACGQVCMMGTNLELRKPTQEELAKVNLQALQIARELYKAGREVEAASRSSACAGPGARYP